LNTEASADEVRELRVSLTVDDLDEAVRLYHDGLGLPIAQQWASAEGRGLVLAAGRATLELLDQTHAGFVDRIEVGRRVAGPVRLAFEVPKVEAATATAQENGASLMNGTVQTPWGDLNQRLQTADGLQLTLFQLLVDDN
jgi:catechol 2,3-dioxygenase-like lactoylglutathione lyase family enzyme